VNVPIPSPQAASCLINNKDVSMTNGSSPTKHVKQDNGAGALDDSFQQDFKEVYGEFCLNYFKLNSVVFRLYFN